MYWYCYHAAIRNPAPLSLSLLLQVDFGLFLRSKTSWDYGTVPQYQVLLCRDSMFGNTSFDRLVKEYDQFCFGIAGIARSLVLRECRKHNTIPRVWFVACKVLVYRLLEDTIACFCLVLLAFRRGDFNYGQVMVRT